MLKYQNVAAVVVIKFWDWIMLLGNSYGNNWMFIATKKKTQLPPMETKPSSEDILNAILPPREWVENGKI